VEAATTILFFYPRSRLLKSPNIGMGRVLGVGSRGRAIATKTRSR